MQIKSRETVWIGKHFAVVIANGDYSGMEDDDIKLIDTWLENNPADVYSFYDADGDSQYDFCRCEVTGLMSDCIACELVNFE